MFWSGLQTATSVCDDPLGLVFLVMAAMFLLRNIIEQSELMATEKLLEIEYRLAELTEAVKTQRPTTPGTDA